MICPNCALPDLHNGDGDGIGSCECERCELCGAGPQQCRCAWDDGFGQWVENVTAFTEQGLL